MQFLHYILVIVSPALISNCITDIDVPKEITEKKVTLFMLSAIIGYEIVVWKKAVQF